MSVEKSNVTNKRIYLDNGASTVVDERVVSAMAPYWREIMGNVGSIHEEGRNAKHAVSQARDVVSKAIDAQPQDIVFTSGGTESNNLAIFGTVHGCLASGKALGDIHVITSVVEHNSVIDCFQELEKRGVRVTYVPVDEFGAVDMSELEKAITQDTVLISLIYVNNEVGTIQNMTAVMHAVRKAKKKNSTGEFPLVHIDACQAPAWVHVGVQKLGVDLMSLDGQKLYGPKGVGCLYIRNKSLLQPLLFGGGQEFGLRAGTPPTPLIVGFAEALRIVEEERDTYVTSIREIQDWCISEVQKSLPNVSVHGPVGDDRIAGNVNFFIRGVEGEQVVIELDMKGVAVSTGSACLSEKTGGSHVVRALHTNGILDGAAIRFTFGRHTTKEEVQKATHDLIETVEWLRNTH
jgi:cysteine desulfurase